MSRCQLATLDRPRSGDDDGAAHVENASVGPTQRHDQGDSTEVGAGLLEQLELQVAPVVPCRRRDLHVLPRLLGDGTCLTAWRAGPRASCGTWVGDDPNASTTNLRFRFTYGH
jgi:hypothetical protein